MSKRRTKLEPRTVVIATERGKLPKVMWHGRGFHYPTVYQVIRWENRRGVERRITLRRFMQTTWRETE